MGSLFKHPFAALALAFAALAMGRASRPFTVFALDGAAGLAGLLAFWQLDSAPPPLPKKTIRVAGDGTSKVKDYIGVAASIAIVWFGIGAVMAGLWTALGLDAILGVAVLFFAIRGARW